MSHTNRRQLLLAGGAILAPGVWSQPTRPAAPATSATSSETLRQAGQRRGVKVGAAVSSDQVLRDPAFRAALLRDCALIVPEWEMKWTTVRRTPQAPDFTGVDHLAAFARGNGLGMRGHPLVWHAAMPDWALQALRAGQADTMLTNHIRLLGGRYAGHVNSWDVVNEAVRPEDGQPAGLRDTPWLRALGPGYIEKAFVLAHATDPSARLVYNDYNIEYEPAKADAILNLVKKLKDQGVPLHAVGLQSHLWASRRRLNLPVLSRFCRALAQEGLSIQITELDVRETDFDLPVDERDKRAADVVDVYLDTVFAEAVPTELVFWGLSDRYSWLSKPQFNPENPRGLLNRGLPYDADLRAKPMWHTVLKKIQSLPLLAR